MSYKHLTKSERYYIEQRKANHPAISLRALGREMNRSHTTLSRELRRNLDQEFEFYSGIRAETLTINRKKAVNLLTRKMPKPSEIVSNFLVEALQKRTSHEQICGRLKLKLGIRISHATLYSYIAKDRKNGVTLYLNLRHGINKYRRSLIKRTFAR